ncbi:hypothetical protein B0H63DRAFT_523420 [Podospora didyma]|uniref:Uncharacterized protein n=1 Tax=Podospora didyma TaxID=330526 RepID=A0AAE0NRB9_9PEZI|nr:hypothetical protein B0H63DRAFT_523420 [Podospora didyma]
MYRVLTTRYPFFRQGDKSDTEAKQKGSASLHKWVKGCIDARGRLVRFYHDRLIQQNISLLARNFITSLLNPSPRFRPSAAQALDSPWLKDQKVPGGLVCVFQGHLDHNCPNNIPVMSKEGASMLVLCPPEGQVFYSGGLLVREQPRRADFQSMRACLLDLEDPWAINHPTLDIWPVAGPPGQTSNPKVSAAWSPDGRCVATGCGRYIALLEISNYGQLRDAERGVSAIQFADKQTLGRKEMPMVATRNCILRAMVEYDGEKDRSCVVITAVIPFPFAVDPISGVFSTIVAPTGDKYLFTVLGSARRMSI